MELKSLNCVFGSRADRPGYIDRGDYVCAIQNAPQARKCADNLPGFVDPKCSVPLDPSPGAFDSGRLRCTRSCRHANRHQASRRTDILSDETCLHLTSVSVTGDLTDLVKAPTAPRNSGDHLFNSGDHLF